jgi:ribonuclease HII
LVKGDARSYSIAAASVLAKVTRDRLMKDLDRQFPNYGFAEHKGYSTPQHLAALRALGPSAIHRRSFGPMRPVELDLFLDQKTPATGGAPFDAQAPIQILPEQANPQPPAAAP